MLHLEHHSCSAFDDGFNPAEQSQLFSTNAHILECLYKRPKLNEMCIIVTILNCKQACSPFIMWPIYKRDYFDAKNSILIPVSII
jgi:hypothetical protein